jgi:hypothetical protein
MTTADKMSLVGALFTGLSALASLAVLVATWRIVKATDASVQVMKAQQRAATRPYIEVSAYVRRGATMLMLSVKNTGNSAAQNVVLKLDKDFFYNAQAGDSNNIRNYPLFSQPVASLGPRSELKFNLGTGAKVLNDPKLCPLLFDIHAEYSFDGETVVETTTIDLTPFVRTVAHQDPAVEQLARIAVSAEKIRALMEE